ncbi:MAG: hypothetical protein MUO76_07835 [Anaerolineaceae bacterium]|nr:hypothetical protein [Anaerolineaceae bacterium]
MQLIAGNLAEIAALLIWVALWALGGVWIARTAFNLRRNEQAIAGFGLGLILENWSANLLAQFIPVPAAFWGAAALVFCIGLGFSSPFSKRRLFDLVRIPIYPLQWLSLALLAYVFISTGRGLAMLDDFQNLPITSLIGTGDIPPHFALDPNVNFGYHYFSMLFAGQLMRIGDFFVWTSLDLARGLSFAVSVVLTALFVQRVTRSRLGGIMGALMAMFAGGTRWLLLLLPPGMVAKISANLNMIGSGVNSGPDLSAALLNPWATSGGGPYPFPFAFVNGANSTSAMLFHSGSGGLGDLLFMLLLLTHNRWRGWRAWLVVAVLIASWGLANEVTLVRIGIGFVLVVLIYMLTKRSYRLPRSLWRWVSAGIAGGVIALFQGGVLTAMVLNWISKLIPGLVNVQAYHTFQFSLFWPPAFLSSHLGYLSIDNIYQVAAALAEIGPIILVLPLVFFWMLKSFRYGRWFETALGVSAFASMGLFFVELSGAAGITALTRAQGMIIGLCKTFAVPVLWLWGRHRSEKVKAWIAVFFLVTMLGGVILLGIQLIAIPEPVYSDFITTLDTRMTGEFWNQLESDAMIFDPLVYRAPVVFGRVSNAAYDWFERKPEWVALYDTPDPLDIHESGYDYIYMGRAYWDELSPENQMLLQMPCVEVIREYTQEFPEDFRWLLDIRNCR